MVNPGGRACPVLCLTPVRNEATRLPAFLDAASTWADAIVIADQGSVDGSREIAQAHPKVLLVDNPSTALDEAVRQKLLLDTARAEFPGARVLFLIDADEALTAGPSQSEEWTRIFDAAPGTGIRMPWIHPYADGCLAWRPPRPKRFGLVDDGRAATTQHMHAGRLPASPVDELVLDTIGVLHFHYLDLESLRAKQRWYQVWHRIHHPDLRPAQIYRRYHRGGARPVEEMVPTDPAWWRAYEEAGIDVTVLGRGAGAAYWDEMTVALLVREGPERFRSLDVWDYDWSAAAAAIGVATPSDPRRVRDRWALSVLAATRGAKSRFVKGLSMRAAALAGW